MTTTLPNGTKIPDVASTNWAGDLEVNWQLLDAAIGAIGSNVQTNRPNTWTAAQTFSEPIIGNLTGTASRAGADEDGTSIKTGYVNVAGIQTVTGQKTWGGIQFFTADVYRKNTSYEIGNTPASNIALPFYFSDKNNAYVGYVRNVVFTTGKSQTELQVRNKFTSGALSPTGTDVTSTFSVELQPNGDKTLYFDGSIRNNVLPYTANSYALGSSSYQWSSVYAQSYFYNGTAWGLNQNNTWTGENTFSSTLKQVNSNVIKGTIPQSDTTAFNMYWGGTGVSSLNNALFAQRGYINADGSTTYTLYALENATGGTQTQLSLKYDPNDTVNKRYAYIRGDFRPYADNTFNLGTSTNKWKTLNGVNPGALSLPDYDSNAKIDISGSITPDQYNNIYYTPPVNGWLYVCFNISSATTSDPIFYIQAKDNNVANSSFVQTSWMLASVNPVNLAIFFPVVANKRFIMQINFSNYTIIKAHIIPCLGNV